MPPTSDTAIRVTVVNDYEVVVRGVAALLEPFADRVEVMELDSQVLPTGSIDVALYDAFSTDVLNTPMLDELLALEGVRHTAVYTWHLPASFVSAAVDRGAAGVLSKTLTAAELVDALEAVARGELVVSSPPDGLQDDFESDWPARDQGLTARESEIVALIVQGLSNNEIASRTYLSINSVKSYIRSAYRRMGVTTRSQAILWGLDHGLDRGQGRIEVTRVSPRRRGS